jgi:predicted Fe-Mo cluster-binding NifX family protein
VKIAVPIIRDGGNDPMIDHRWGRADWIAIADISDGKISDWQEIEVLWDKAHNEGTHGSHHARISKFLTSNGITMVVADHMGEGMLRMLDTMKITIALDASGSAKEAVLTAITLT